MKACWLIPWGDLGYGFITFPSDVLCLKWRMLKEMWNLAELCWKPLSALEEPKLPPQQSPPREQEAVSTQGRRYRRAWPNWSEFQPVVICAFHCQGKALEAITSKSQQCKGKIKNCFANNKDQFLVGLKALCVESVSRGRHMVGKSSKLASIKRNAVFLRPDLQISYKVYSLQYWLQLECIMPFTRRQILNAAHATFFPI